MILKFTKCSGKNDSLEIIRRGSATEVISCPKQRIIPHDMLHYAVEMVMAELGFLGRVAAGEAASLTMESEPVSDGIERLVEVMQGDSWSGGESAVADILELYRVTCFARQCPVLPIDAATILAIRERVAKLSVRWEALAVGETLELSFES